MDLSGPRRPCTGQQSEDRAHRESKQLQLVNGVQSVSNNQWCPMNLTRELSGILTRVLNIENSILQRIILVRRMEQQHVEADVYVNRGENSEFENPEFEYRGNPTPPLPPLLAQIRIQT